MNRRAYLLGVVAVFAASVAAVALRAFADASFLASYGPRELPLYLVCQAGAFALVTAAYDAATARATAPRVDRVLGLGLVALALAAAPLVARGQPWPFVIGLAVVALSSVVSLGLWNLVAASVAGRDARRMLPRAGAAVTLGGALAGLVGAALVRGVGPRPVAWLGGAGALAALVAAVAAQRALTAGGAPGATAPPGTSATAVTGDHRALLRWLVAAAVLEAAVATVLEFRFGAALKARYHGDALFVALSLFSGGTHLVLLALQALVVPRLLTSRRLPVTMSIHPAVTGLGLVALGTVAGFGAIAAVRSLDWVLRAATSRTGQEISLSALPPVPRARWKVLLRGGATPLGALMAGAAILAAGPPAVTAERLAGALALVVVVWLVVVGTAARRFLAALAAPLGMKVIALARRWRAALDLELLTGMVTATGDRDPAVAIAARAALHRAGGAADEIAPHLAHDEPQVRRALYELAARRPRPGARHDLATAAAIEDDPRALAAAVRALAAHGDGDALAAIAARALDEPAVRAALTAAGATGSADPLAREGAATALVPHDGAWAAALVGRAGERYDAAVAEALAAGGERRRQGLVAATAGGDASVAALTTALAADDREAFLAVADLDDAGARRLVTELPVLGPAERAAIARARAAADAPGALLAALAEDDDDEVRAAALRSLAGHARAGQPPAAELCARLVERERTAVAALAAARPGPGEAPPLHAAEVERALRAALERLLTALALASAAAGRDPAALLAAGRRLVTAPDAARRRALDVVQELATVDLRTLDTVERALRPPVAADPRARGLVDPWLAALLAGEHTAREPALAALRACRFFDALPGRHADELAGRAGHRFLAPGDVLLARGDVGDAMFVIVSGSLAVELGRDGARPTLGPGRVVGELALLAPAPRAATVRATSLTEVLVIDRTTFEAARARWPDLGLALCRGLAEELAAPPAMATIRA